MRGMIFNIQRFSTEDGPGIRTTVFMKGCPLRCVWCQNPEGIKKERELVWHPSRCIGARECVRVCRENALSPTEGGVLVDRGKCTGCGDCALACPSGALGLVGKWYGKDELLDEVLRDAAFYSASGGGATFGGGEPVAQANFLREVLPELKGRGVHVAVDTCGNVPWANFEEILDHVDLFIYDLKILDGGRLRAHTGGDTGLITGNARSLSSRGVPIWVRTPVIPGYTDDEENIRSISRFVAENLQTSERFELLAFNNLCRSKYEGLGVDWELKDAPLIGRGRMEELEGIARGEGVKNARWSGLTS